MYMKTHVQAYLLQCLCSPKTGNQSKCLAIEDQIYKLHFIHSVITSFRRMGKIYMYRYMEWSPTFVVNCKKQGAQELNGSCPSSSCPSWSTLHSCLFHPLPLESNLYQLHPWAPRSSDCCLYLASGGPQHGMRRKENEVWVFTPFMPWTSNFAVPPPHACFLLSSSNHSLSSFPWA